MTTDDDAVRALAEAVYDEIRHEAGWSAVEAAIRAALPAYHAAQAAGGLEAAVEAVYKAIQGPPEYRSDLRWRADIRAALAPHWPAEPSGDPGRLPGVREALRRLVESIDALVAESEGVAGLHRNGDVAPWGELVEGGQFGAWLGDALGSARDALAAAPGEPQPDPVRQAFEAERERADRLTELVISLRGDADWSWLGDGTDDLASMSDGMVVRMTAGQLRALLTAQGEPQQGDSQAWLVRMGPRIAAETLERVLAGLGGEAIERVIVSEEKAYGSDNSPEANIRSGYAAVLRAIAKEAADA